MTPYKLQILEQFSMIKACQSGLHAKENRSSILRSLLNWLPIAHLGRIFLKANPPMKPLVNESSMRLMTAKSLK